MTGRPTAEALRRAGFEVLDFEGWDLEILGLEGLGLEVLGLEVLGLEVLGFDVRPARDFGRRATSAISQSA